jgi:predicted DNA-binding protein with PD1-like motif
MRARQVAGETPRRSFVLVLDAGDEIVRAISQFAEQYDLRAAHFTALGALASARLGYWLPGTSEYEPIEVAEQVEVLSLVGNVAWSGQQRRVHAHITIGTRDGTARGGHLLEGQVNPTLEMILHELPEVLRRTKDAATGLPLLDLRSESPRESG